MNIRMISNYIGRVLLIETAFMLPAAIIAMCGGDWKSAMAFGAVILGAALVGAGLKAIPPGERTIYAKEGFVTVAISWIVMSLIGALPFFISGSIPNLCDSIFETVSGFTTTGASVVKDVEALPKSMLYWRSFTNWLGGMGVIVFLLAMTPIDKAKGSLLIMKAESPGPIVGKLAPKLRRTAVILYEIYIALTVLEFIMLACGGMPIFDSVCHALSTAGTGGFSTKNASIGFYNGYIQTVVGVFMILFGVNFNVFYLIIVGKIGQALKSEEVRTYFGIVIFSTAAIVLNVVKMFESTGIAIRHGFFQVASMMTTTGFSTADFNTWPQFSKSILVFLMLFGACAGSTAGGIKISRLLILIKSLKNTVKKMIRPRTVKLIKMDGENVEEDTVREVTVYMTAYVLIFLASVLIVSLDGKTFETTCTSVIATLNNIGPGLGDVGPTGNFAGFSVLSKIVLSLDMLIGRLEIFPMLMLVSPSVWKKDA